MEFHSELSSKQGGPTRPTKIDRITERTRVGQVLLGSFRVWFNIRSREQLAALRVRSQIAGERRQKDWNRRLRGTFSVETTNGAVKIARTEGSMFRDSRAHHKTRDFSPAPHPAPIPFPVDPVKLQTFLDFVDECLDNLLAFG